MEYLKMFGFAIVIFAVSVLLILFLTPVAAALVLSILFLVSFYFRSHKHAGLRAHLKMYEETANKLTSGEKVANIAPISLSDDEVLGPAYNDLIKYVGDSATKAHKNKQLIKSVTTVIDAPLVIISANGRIDYANNSFSKLAKRDVLKNSSYEKVRNKELRTLLEDVLIREGVTKKEVEIKNKYYDAVSQPLYDEDGIFSGIVVLLHDVTELKSYQNLQREFFTNASHELKTPITAIKGCIEILISGSAKGNMAKEFLNIIAKENLRLENLVKDLFLINRYDTYQINLEKEILCLNEIIEDVIVQTETIAELKGQLIEFMNEEQIEFEGDALRLEQCFLNLLTNAIHYSPDETRIEITIAKIDSKIEIKIKDYGTGIRKEDLPHIFDRFYRIDRSRNRHTGGTGLGLTIVKSTIEAHNGNIVVESEEEVGTVFTITLPA